MLITNNSYAQFPLLEFEYQYPMIAGSPLIDSHNGIDVSIVNLDDNGSVETYTGFMDICQPPQDEMARLNYVGTMGTTQPTNFKITFSEPVNNIGMYITYVPKGTTVTVNTNSGITNLNVVDAFCDIYGQSYVTVTDNMMNFPLVTGSNLDPTGSNDIRISAATPFTEITLNCTMHKLYFLISFREDSPGFQIENSANLCSDGLDNDGDGQIDCADSDCAAFCDTDGDGYIAGNNDPDDNDPCNPDNTVAACDTDGDGVADGNDNCANTPNGTPVDATGCPDTDGDAFTGINDPDGNDPCNPDPNGAACPTDTDGDGIADENDNCPNTPNGTAVDATGCPDTDGDAFTGVNDPDGNDPCNPDPNDAACVADADGDGYTVANDPDDNDPCNPDNTVAACDTDGDGVADGNDNCANTPNGTAVDATGCPDTDGDAFTGVNDPDGNDPCNPDPNDAACTSPENTAAACSDGIDNDGDGQIDCADGDCANFANCAVENTAALCSDGIDNDGDGQIDCADGDCAGIGACGPENTAALCSDGIDNDGDGQIDCADSDCANFANCNTDNDGDGVPNNLDTAPNDPCQPNTHPSWVAQATNDCDNDGTTVAAGDSNDFDACIDFTTPQPQCCAAKAPSISK